MSEVRNVLWTFLPGQCEGDSFDYLNDVRLALREIRLAGVRSISQVTATGVVSEDWDSVIKTYSIPLLASTYPVLMTCAATWLQANDGRSLRIAAGQAETRTAMLGEVESVLGQALAETLPVDE